ncbi:MAG: pimeloyl-ACP methyl ester carboxylesterase [Maribacter sp.]|jgi:pimeloyl-ACP methyl ester carboxylesterase
MTISPSINDFTGNTPIKAPSKLLFLTEGGRAAIGLGLYAATRKMLRNLPKGDGHPVLVAPGFMTSDRVTYILRSFLKDLGYEPQTWNLGVNLGRPEYAYRMLTRVEQIHEEYGQKVSIVGWSLGGVFAREVARLKPELIRQVITLGSPFRDILGENNGRWFYDLLHGPNGVDIEDVLIKDMAITPPVPITALYSKNDGIVNWQHCMEAEENSMAQNVQVAGSHSGLGHNPTVLYCIAERLQQAEDEWKKFEPQGMMKLLYPNL